MGDIALYYPTMNVPESPWLMRTLLYWDQVASIVPEAMQAEVSEHPFTHRLLNLGQLVLIDPSEALAKPGVEDDIHQALDIMGRLNPHRSEDAHLLSSNSGLRNEKMLYSVRLRLEELGYVRSSNLDDWLRVDNSIAGWYMGLLAGIIAGSYQRDNENSVVRPVTGSHAELNSFLNVPNNKVASGYVCRVIHDVLPSPLRPLDPEEIAEFKEAHGEELRRLRNWVDKKILEGSQYEDEQLSIWARGLKFEVEEDIVALSEAMKRRRWPKVALVGVGGVVASGLSLVNDVVTSMDVLSLGLTAGSSVIGLASAGMSLAELRRAPKYDHRAPLAYAALATTSLDQSR
jgi:hypothetical protein